MIASRRRPGMISRKSANRFSAVSVCWRDRPVTLPPDREKLATKPMPSGSESAGKTIGMVRVCSNNAAVLRVVLETMRSGCSATSSFAKRRIESASVGAADPYVAALCPPELLESVQERCDQSLPRTALVAHQHPNQPHPLWLLRARRERPRGRAVEQQNERAASHSITHLQS